MKQWQPRSKAEGRVDIALKAVSNFDILHEYQIGNRLRLDFYIKELRLAVEVHGDQHYKPNSFFYEDAEARKAAKRRDDLKAELCQEQGIVLVVLPQSTVMDARTPEVLGRHILLLYKESLTNAQSQESW